MDKYTLYFIGIALYLTVWVTLVVMCFVGDLMWVVAMVSWGMIPLFFSNESE